MLRERFWFSGRFIFLCCAAVFAVVTLPPLHHWHSSINGGYTEWSSWSACFATCGPSVMGRTRNCTNPRPYGYGELCVVIGPHIETTQCEITKCPVDGNWGYWTNWGNCVPSCKDGRQSRTRQCDNPSTAYGGKTCDGESKEERQCDWMIPCPIDGGLSEWGGWSECSASCNSGHRTRERFCNNPAPRFNGKGCGTEQLHEVVGCNTQPCVVTTISTNITSNFTA
ncbi:mucin-like protein [Hydractinia symbiolongicarpus]|uniref:mucin-like protein n=1 Tax=Hydractinia symbiolongicarpus TaxID=13093 RepID=UPI002550A344|nr:mucin-like protein [Hydractinia symbiolongicarpus]